MVSTVVRMASQLKNIDVQMAILVKDDELLLSLNLLLGSFLHGRYQC